jgi:sialate O-acetylesterase
VTGEARAMTTNRLLRLAAAAALIVAASSLRAEVKLPRIIGNHMVLQRDQPIHLWGWAEPGERVSASFNGTAQSTEAGPLGKWSLYLSPQRAGGPYSLTVSGANTIQLDDVMVGDVWFASGQSNMEMPLEGFRGSAVVNNAAQEIQNANQPNLRLLLVRKKASDHPLQDYEAAGWTPCTPETAAKFSAVAYFFGREIAEHEHVAVGLIDSTWGGTPAEAWVSMDGLASDSALMPVFAEWARMANEWEDVPRIIQAERREEEAARQAGRPVPRHPWHPNPASWAPAALFNGMVAPAIGLRIKGVIWYQGESNSALARAALYEKLFQTLIRDWRFHWREGNFPFLFAQISNFQSTPRENWAVIREAQRRALALVNTGMAVTIDIGDPDNVHPSNKQDVGARLALAARAIAYGGKDLEYSGPIFRETSVEDRTVRVWFDHAASGLVAKGGALQGFEIAGDDHRFVPASARIDGATVVVTADSVAAPKYVRYGWSNSPAVNLFNGAGLPASPFTSEAAIPLP